MLKRNKMDSYSFLERYIATNQELTSNRPYDRYGLPHGFVKVAAIVPKVCIGNPEKNIEDIIRMLSLPELSDADIIATPELSVTGYTCADLFFQNSLIAEAETAVRALCAYMMRTGDPRTVVIGAPVSAYGRLFNCAILIRRGRICGIVPKRHIPNYQEFYERRWFSPAPEEILTLDYAGQTSLPFGTDCIFEAGACNIGIEICEDMWVPAPPSAALAMAGADVIVNLSATDETLGKNRYLRNLISNRSATGRAVYIYASAGNGESSTDLSFAGNAIIAEDGRIVAASPRFNRSGDTFATATVDVERLKNDRIKYNTFGDMQKCGLKGAEAFLHINTDPGNEAYENDRRHFEETDRARMPLDMPVDPHPFVPSDSSRLRENCEEITHIQSWGLEQRLLATGCRRLVVGISGGLDSTLALLVAVMAFRRLGFDLKGIIGVTMPGEATTSRTRNNAVDLMKELGVTAMEIPIGKAVAVHFSDIGQDPELHDAAYENSQARERTQILMDLANKEGAMVLGTGDLSELALGWCTYNGDHMSMYAVNAGVPKTLVRYLVSWFADTTGNEREAATLRDIIDTPISPELIPAKEGDDIAQKTEDIVGPYELHDFFLYHVLRNGFSPEKIFRMARTAFAGQYDDATLLKWLGTFYRRFFSQQFKRSCMPDGPKVGSVCLSPRGDWRMPSDACSRLWMRQVGELADADKYGGEE